MFTVQENTQRFVTGSQMIYQMIGKTDGHSDKPKACHWTILNKAGKWLYEEAESELDVEVNVEDMDEAPEEAIALKRWKWKCRNKILDAWLKRFLRYMLNGTFLREGWPFSF